MVSGLRSLPGICRTCRGTARRSILRNSPAMVRWLNRRSSPSERTARVSSRNGRRTGRSISPGTRAAGAACIAGTASASAKCTARPASSCGGRTGYSAHAALRLVRTDNSQRAPSMPACRIWRSGGLCAAGQRRWKRCAPARHASTIRLRWGKRSLRLSVRRPAHRASCASDAAA